MGVFQNKIFIDYYGFLQRSLYLSNVHSHDQCNICGELGWLVAAPGNTHSQLYLRGKNYKFHCSWSHGNLGGPSDNFQYCRVAGSMRRSSHWPSVCRRLMFQESFFSLFLEKFSAKILSFLIFYNFTKIRSFDFWVPAVLCFIFNLSK